MEFDDQIRMHYQLGLAAWERVLQAGCERAEAEALFNAVPELEVYVKRLGSQRSPEEAEHAAILMRIIQAAVDELEEQLSGLLELPREPAPERSSYHLMPRDLAKELARYAELGATDATRETRRRMLAQLHADIPSDSDRATSLN